MKPNETTKEMIIRKLTSRKLWLSITALVSGIMLATGHTESQATQLCGIILQAAAVLSYCIGEGLADSGDTVITTQQEDTTPKE